MSESSDDLERRFRAALPDRDDPECPTADAYWAAAAGEFPFERVRALAQGLGQAELASGHPHRLVHHHQVRGEHRHVVAAGTGHIGPAEDGIASGLLLG